MGHAHKSQQQSVDYRDFISDTEIQNFIKCILNLKNPKSNRVFIQSDYLNYGDIFEKIKGKRIAYCSSEYNGGHLKNNNQLQTEKNSIKTYFGNNSTYRISSNKRLLHPRAVFYNDIIIYLDHDYPQISIANSNWRISFHYCIETFNEKISLINSYRSV